MYFSILICYFPFHSDRSIVSDMKDRLTKHYSCTICQEIFINPSVTNCGDTFCYQCIKKWSGPKRKLANCPLCRKRIRKISPNPAINGYIEDCISDHFTKEEKDSRTALIEERLLEENTVPDGADMGTIDSEEERDTIGDYGNMGCRVFKEFFRFFFI